MDYQNEFKYFQRRKIRLGFTDTCNRLKSSIKMPFNNYRTRYGNRIEKVHKKFDINASKMWTTDFKSKAARYSKRN